MNLIEALKTGKPLRRPIAKHLGSHGDGWIGNEFIKDSLLQPWPATHYSNVTAHNFISEDDLFADDWEIKSE